MSLAEETEAGVSPASRLLELIGEPPPGAEAAWPGAAPQPVPHPEAVTSTA